MSFWLFVFLIPLNLSNSSESIRSIVTAFPQNITPDFLGASRQNVILFICSIFITSAEGFRIFILSEYGEEIRQSTKYNFK